MRKIITLLLGIVLCFSLPCVIGAAEVPEGSEIPEIPEGFTQVKHYEGTYGFGPVEITAYTDDDFSKFHITFTCFGEDQELDGTVEEGKVTVTYDRSGFMGGDAQQIWDDAMTSDVNWTTVSGGTDVETDEPETAAAAVEDMDTAAYNSQELWLQRDDQPIYGVLCTPLEQKAEYPLVIISHGLGTTADQTIKEAQFFAEHGFAAYAFDFCGGSDRSRSGSADGDMTQMSVLTEAADLSAVMDQLLEMDTIDNDSVFLLGMSQGGYVSAYVASQRPDDVCALGLEYPAFALQDGCLELYQDTPAEEIPEVVNYIGRDLGRIYFTDAMSLDIYEEIAKYNGDVLILHGDQDTLVDLTYSEEALEVYPSAELSVYEGAAHGFFGDDELKAREEMLIFFESHLPESDNESAAELNEPDNPDFSNWTEIVTEGIFDQPIVWEQLPEGYSSYANECQGTVLRLHYTTDAYDDGETYEKYCTVYLPYGYDENDTETKYNVLYFQHGNHGSPNQFWDHVMKAADCSNLFANLFDEDTAVLEKCIIICPTYYFDTPEDGFVTPEGTDAGDGMPEASKSAYYKEIVEDLIPQIESQFHVYCEDFSEEGIKASRDHRAWAGYSRGAFCTWNVMHYDFEYFKYWIPCSGTITAIDGRDTSTPELQYEYIKETIDTYPDLDFFLMGYVGGEADQSLVENYIPLMQCLYNDKETFSYGTDPAVNNFYFVISDYAHNDLYFPYILANAKNFLFIDEE